MVRPAISSARRCRDAKRSRGAPALVTPVMAFTQEKPGSNQRTQDANARARPPIRLMSVYQDMANNFRAVQHEACSSEEPTRDQLVFIGSASVHGDAVGPHAPGELERAHAIGSRLRHSWSEEL